MEPKKSKNKLYDDESFGASINPHTGQQINFDRKIAVKIYAYLSGLKLNSKVYSGRESNEAGQSDQIIEIRRKNSKMVCF